MNRIQNNKLILQKVVPSYYHPKASTKLDFFGAYVPLRVGLYYNMDNEELKQNIKQNIKWLLEYISQMKDPTSKKELVDVCFPKFLFNNQIRTKILTQKNITNQDFLNKIISNKLFSAIAIKNGEQFNKLVEQSKIHKIDPLLDELQGYVKGKRRRKQQLIKQLKETLIKKNLLQKSQRKQSN